MIIVGYPCIGKSTLSNNSAGFMDLESSCWKVGEYRHDDWFKTYCNVAIDLSKQGNVVFVSSHKYVRDELEVRCLDEDFSEEIYVCFPSHDLEAAWKNKLRNRYSASKLIKDKLALERAEKFYKSDIAELAYCGFKKIVITEEDYDLKNVVLSAIH